MDGENKRSHLNMMAGGLLSCYNAFWNRVTVL